MSKKAQKVVNTSGKRKTAIARDTTRAGTGKIRINKVPRESYGTHLVRLKILEPLKLAGDRADKLDVDVKVDGGGIIGQAEATRIAIARGFVDFLDDEELKETYMKFDRSFLVNDPRRKMPKQPLGRGARKKRQKSYR